MKWNKFNCDCIATKCHWDKSHWLWQQSDIFLFPDCLWFTRTATWILNITVSSSLWGWQFAWQSTSTKYKLSKKICLILPTPVISHGQLYVALSRVRFFQFVTFLAPSRSIYNCVYKEVLDTLIIIISSCLKSLKYIILTYKFVFKFIQIK